MNQYINQFKNITYFKKYFRYKAENNTYKMKKYIKRLQSGGNNYEFNVQEPWFEFIKNGDKTVEGRLNSGKFANLKVGDIIEWHNQNMSFKVVITYVNKYKSFREMITTEGLEKVLPSIDSIDTGVAIYRKFYDETREKNSGVLAIGMKIL